MSSRIARSWLCTIAARAVAVARCRRSSAQSRPSATSLHREVELVARDEIDRRALAQAFLRLHRHLGADEADLQRRVRLLQRRRHLHVRRERRRRGVDHAQLVVARLRRSPRRGRCRAGGASISLLPGTSAAGCASQVGYQNDCGSPAAPGSASRRRRRTRRTTADAGTASSSSRVEPLRLHGVAAPVDLAAGIARGHHGHRHKLAQRQKPERGAIGKGQRPVDAARGQRADRPGERRTRPATRARRRPAARPARPRPAGTAAPRRRTATGTRARIVRAQRSSWRQSARSVVSGTVVAGTVSASAHRQAEALDQPAEHVVVGQMVHQGGEAADPLQRLPPQHHGGAEAVLPPHGARQQRAGEEVVVDLHRAERGRLPTPPARGGEATPPPLAGGGWGGAVTGSPV